MKIETKNIIKRFLNKIGVEAHRFIPSNSPLARLMSAINANKINLIFDIGANEGQFVIDLRNHGYKEKVVSFEPLSSAHLKCKTLSKKDGNWHVHEQTALGNTQGEIDINVAGNSASSSILPMLDAHISAAPHTSYIKKEKVPITTLDNITDKYITSSSRLLLKIDTQGYEWFVIEGAKNTLAKASGVLIELSAIPLYDGQYLWKECIEKLENDGFILWSLEPIFFDPISGKVLQWDGLFFRKQDNL